MVPMELGDRQKALLSVLLMVTIVILMMLAAEGMIRLRQYVKYGSFGNLNAIQQMDEKLGLRVPQAGSKTATVTINSLGFRGPEIDHPKPKDRIRFAFIGASTTYCAEVSSNEKVWADMIVEELKSAFPDTAFDYINGGVPGYTTESSIVNLEKRILPLHPDIVVIYHATNDLSAEMRELASAQGIAYTNLDSETSWLSEYSLLWNLAEKNLKILLTQRLAGESNTKFQFNPAQLGEGFRQRMVQLAEKAKAGGVDIVAFVTFSMQLRPGQSKEQMDRASISARYYMPFMAPEQLLTGFARYNDIVREAAAETRALLIGGEDTIPGDAVHFNDSVHFTDAGSRKQADRIVKALINSPQFQALVN